MVFGTEGRSWDQYVVEFNNRFFDAAEAAGIDPHTVLPQHITPLVRFYYDYEVIGEVALSALKAVSDAAKQTFSDDVVITKYHLLRPAHRKSITEILKGIDGFTGSDVFQVPPGDDFAENVKLYDAALSVGLPPDSVFLLECNFETTLKERLVTLEEIELVLDHFDEIDELYLMVAENVAHFRRHDSISNIVEYELFMDAHRDLGENVTGFDNMAEKGRAQLFEFSL